MSEPILCLDLDGESPSAALLLVEAGFEVLRASSLEQARRFVAQQSVGALVACGQAAPAAAAALALPTVLLLRESNNNHPLAPLQGRTVALRDPEELAELPRAIERLVALSLRDSAWRAVADALPQAMLLLDERGRVLDANLAAEALLGPVLRQTPGPPIAAVLGLAEGGPPNLADRCATTVTNARGQSFEVQLLPLASESAALLCLVQAVDRVTGPDSRPAQRSATTREERYRRLFEANIAPIFFWEADGRITDANEAFLALIERTADELRQGQIRWDQVTAPEDLALDRLAMSQFAAGELQRATYEKHLLARDGRRVPVLIGGAPLAGRTDAGVAFALDLSSRKRAEEALRESEERLGLALEAGRMGIFDWDLATGQLAWSAYHYVLFGYRAGECTPSLEVWQRSVHPDDWPKVEATLQTAIAEGNDFRHEYRVLLAGDEVRWLASAGRCQRDEANRVVRLRGGVVDITDRKHVEQALRDSEARARRIFHSDIVGVIYWDLETGQILDANNKFLETTGYSREDLRRGELFWNAMTPADWAAPNAQAIAELTAWGRSRPYEKEYLRKDGSRVPVIVGGALFEGSQREGVSFVLDISDRKRSEEERARLLNAERQRMTRLLKLSEAATAINREDTIESILAAGAGLAANVIGAHQAGASMTIGQQWSKASHALSLSEKYAAWREYDVRPDGTGIYGIVSRENRPLRLTDSELQEHSAYRDARPERERQPPLRGLLAAPLIGRDGGNLGVIQLSDKFEGDFTEEDEALLLQMAQVIALALEKAHLYQEMQEADTRKDEFLATLAHELRNPLAAVSAGVQLLHLPGARDDFEWTIGLIDDQIKQLARLVDDLLDVSRITRGKIQLRLETVDFRQTAERSVGVVQPIFDERRHRLYVELEPRPLLLEADPARLEQILVNLLTNAAKYTDEGGQVWLSAQIAGNELVIRVRDTGIGIPPEMLPRVFDLFAQADQTLDRARGGLGIGLTLVRRLTEMHGGSVAVSSHGVGRGSEFSVRLPLAPQITSSGWFPRLNLDTPPPEPTTILIVEDHPDIARGAARFLEQCSHTVHVAHDGPRGLQLAAQVTPQVVMLDIGLPGMSGYEVAAAIRAHERLRHCLLIAVTGYGQEQDRQQSRAAGFNYHLVKPVDFQLLQQLIGQWQANQRAAPH
ncbi:MAG: PAS domain S-box protein [Pirellulales bacterium]